MPDLVTQKCISAICYTCSAPIWVPTYDWHPERNYCYPCAWTVLGETGNQVRSSDAL